MSTVFGFVALLGFGLALVALIAIIALGLYVVRRHPGEYDPARNAPRFTRPALVFVLLIVLGTLAVAVGLVGAAITSI